MPRSAAVRRSRSCNDDTSLQPSKKIVLQTSSCSPPPRAPASLHASSVSGSASRCNSPRKDLTVVEVPFDEGTAAISVPRGEYTHLKHLTAQGAFGHIVTASWRGRDVVVKKQPTGDSRDCEASYREMRNLMHLTAVAPNPALIELLDCWFHRGHLYLVEEKLDTNLADWIFTKTKRGKQIDPADRKRITIAMMAGMNHLHQCNIIHRDFKPENVVLTDNLSKIKLIDFGSCRKPIKERSEGGPMMTYGRYVCTYPYRAPEIVPDFPDYTMKVDVWSVGCITAELITGRPLFFAKESALPRLHKAFEKKLNDDKKLKEFFKGATAAELKFLKGTLDSNPDTRLSAKEALNIFKKDSKPWMTEHTPFHPPDYKYEDLEQIQEFMHDTLEAFQCEYGTFEPREWDCEKLE